MPKSKRRPAAARKAAASRRARQGTGQVYRFVKAPWTTWQEVSQNPAAPPGILAVLEHTPFQLINPEGTEATVTLAEMAQHLGEEFTGGMAEFTASQQFLADQGFLAWDRASNTAAAVLPADRA